MTESVGLKAALRRSDARVGLGVLAVMSLVAVVGPLLVGDPMALHQPLEPPSFAHWFGTSGQGQDVLAQTVVGAQRSLVLGFGVGFAVVAVGALVGLAAALAGGWIDELLGLLINVFLLLPGLPLAVLLAAWLPPGSLGLALVLTLTGWAWNARIFRAQALALRRKEYILAARAIGEPWHRILFVEMLPNMASLVASCFVGSTVHAIGSEVGLEFLGLGDLDAVTWGTNLYWAAQSQVLLTGSWWTYVPTGAAIALVGFALVQLGSALDSAFTPALRAPARYVAATGISVLSDGLATPSLARQADAHGANENAANRQAADPRAGKGQR